MSSSTFDLECKFSSTDCVTNPTGWETALKEKGFGNSPGTC